MQMRNILKIGQILYGGGDFFRELTETSEIRGLICVNRE